VKKTKVEKIFNYRGLECIITHHATPTKKWRCGYVVIGSSHWAYADDYDLMPNREAYGHSEIHKLHDNKHLAKELNTLEKLKADDKIAKYVSWKQKRYNKHDSN